MQSQSYDYIFKIVLIGDAKVGKTCISTRFATNDFTLETRSTIGIEFCVKQVVVRDNINVKCLLWDSAGSERYRAVASAYYRGANGAFLVYDITNEQSFKNCKKWLNDLKDYCDPIIILVGNKSDLIHLRQVPTGEAQQFAEENKLLFIEVSALSMENIEKAFNNVIEKMIDTPNNNVRDNFRGNIRGTAQSNIFQKGQEIKLLNNETKKCGC
jgi:small GTP-binding protein